MLQTMEIRWFFPQSCPVKLDEQLEEVVEVQDRADWYAMPCSSHSGIKVREGRLEAKLLLTSHGLRTHAAWQGYLESYQKWSLPFGDDDIPSFTALENAGWLEVNKLRHLQRWQIEGDDIHTVSTRPTEGCEFEVTRLHVGQETWWTVGFEAVGTHDQLESNWQRVATHLAQHLQFHQAFTREHSLGYAAWLERFNGTRP